MKNIFGSGGPETLYGSENSDQIFAYGGDDVLLMNGNSLSWSGKDKAFAGNGDDLILNVEIDPTSIRKSPSFGSELNGGQGYDTVYVDIYTDNFGFTFNCSQTHKAIRLSSVEEVFYYSSNGFDKQILHGTDRNETFFFGQHEWSSSVFGAGGDDCMVGGDDADSFDGGSGSDFLDGNGGADKLTGGSGRDVFFLDLKWGGSNTRIVDFIKGQDRIAIGTALSYGGTSDPVDFRRIRESDLAISDQQFEESIDFEKSTRSIYVDDEFVGKINGKFDLDSSDFLFTV